MPHPMISPWLISREGWSAVCAVYDGTPEGRALLDDLRRQRLEAGRAMNGGNGRALAVVDRVAVVPVAGPLFRKAGLFADLSDATSDDKIRADLAAARAMHARGEIDGVLLAIDSPGGEAAGTEQTAVAIRAAADLMPVIAYTEDGAQSKAYWYAAAASHLVAAPTAMLGSIGVRMRMVDESTDPTAPKVHEIVSSQSPGKRALPVDDDVLGRMQVQADDLAAVFIDRVAAYRGTSAEKVAADFGRGDSLIASKALAAGMVDEIGNIDTALAAVRAQSKRKGYTMTTTTSAGPAPATDDAEIVRLGRFRADALAACGTEDADAAIGIIRAGVKASAELADVRARLEAKESEARVATFRGSIEAAITAKRITPAALSCDLVPMLDDGNREKAEAALAALSEAAGVPDQIAAVCGAVALSDGEVRRVSAYLSKRPGPVFAPAPKEAKAPEAPKSGAAAEVSRIAAETRAAHVKQMTTRGTAAAK